MRSGPGPGGRRRDAGKPVVVDGLCWQGGVEGGELGLLATSESAGGGRGLGLRGPGEKGGECAGLVGYGTGKGGEVGLLG